MASINPGIHKAKCVGFEVNDKNGKLELIVYLDVLDEGGVSAGELTTFLYFSEGALKYSIEKLHAMGWKGTTPAELASLSVEQISDQVSIKVEDTEYQGKPQRRVTILTKGGRITASNPVDLKTFAARVAALAGSSFGAASLGGSKPVVDSKDDIPF